MITPQFEVSQNDEYIIVIIRAPYIKASSVDWVVLEKCFKFYAKPYFLRLVFSHELEGGKEKADYDAGKGLMTMHIAKKIPGQEFENLDMITLLLAKTKNQNTSHQIQTLDQKPLDLVEQEINEDKDPEPEDQEDSEEDWEIEQTYPQPIDALLNRAHYGFNNAFSNFFEPLQEILADIVELPNPDQMKGEERRLWRIEKENDDFDQEHYAADFMMDEEIMDILQYTPIYFQQTNTNQALTPADLVTGKEPNSGERIGAFTDDEKYILVNLPNKEYLLDKRTERETLLGLLDILYAICYNDRISQGDPSNDSSCWNITKISSTLSCLDRFTNIRDVVTSFIRRSLIYPLYRHWKLSWAVLKDVTKVMMLGKRYVLKYFLALKRFNENGDNYFYLNRLFIDDYCVWIQTLKTNKLKEIVSEMLELKIHKSDIGLPLKETENLALSSNRSDNE
eukprot:TRINITY_DN4152_c0_g1_i1.p1 TRINITY_DN4152_c0_g1~~TRINITY_DN4152_c0_g1_i1.p1  ORF type:complete len:451 (-),score=89.57 TRINITY_DN4152_c0_g1_i1:118-1470(-)